MLSSGPNLKRRFHRSRKGRVPSTSLSLFLLFPRRGSGGYRVSLPQDDQTAHQDFLKQVASNLALGLLMNYLKSIFIPVQRIEFIGEFSTPYGKGLTSGGSCSRQTHPVTTVQMCLSLLGHMASCTYVVQHVRLCLRPFQAWLATVYSPL